MLCATRKHDPVLLATLLCCCCCLFPELLVWAAILPEQPVYPSLQSGMATSDCPRWGITISTLMLRPCMTSKHGPSSHWLPCCCAAAVAASCSSSVGSFSPAARLALSATRPIALRLPSVSTCKDCSVQEQTRSGESLAALLCCWCCCFSSIPMSNSSPAASLARFAVRQGATDCP